MDIAIDEIGGRTIVLSRVDTTVGGERARADEKRGAPKLERNRQRDARNTAALQQAGWTVIRLWEHDSIEEAVARVAPALAGQNGQRNARTQPPRF